MRAVAIAVAAMMLVGCAGTPDVSAPDSAPPVPALLSSTVPGDFNAGNFAYVNHQPACDSAAVITHGLYNGTHEIMSCSWSCTVMYRAILPAGTNLAPYRGKWRVDFVRAIGSANWGWAAERLDGC